MTIALKRLDPELLHFERHGDTLSLNFDGVYYSRVVVRRCFPVSDECRFLSVRDATSEEQPEIGVIAEWEPLKSQDKDALTEELKSLYFVPRVIRVLRIKEQFGFLYWTVDTDKGSAEFVMRDGVITYTREISPTHWLLIDVNQSRWEIPDIESLDANSRKLIRQHLYI